MFQHKNLEKFIYYCIFAIPVSLLVGVFFLNLNSALISILFITFIILNKNYYIIYNKNSYSFFVLLLLFLLSSIFSNYFLKSIENVASFASHLLLFFGIGYFLSKDAKKSFNISRVVFYVVLLICIDLWIQSIFGKNIFGYEKEQAGRLTSFFKGEQIPGGVIFKLSPFFIYFLFKQKNNFINKFKYLFLFFLYFSILITGERLPSILSTLTLFGFIILNIRLLNYKKVILYLILFILVFGIIYFQNDSIVSERISYTFHQFNDNVYFKLYNNAFIIFKENFLFGTGLQTFRYECSKISEICSTHPHNFFFELLSDTGFISAILFYFALIYLFFNKLLMIKSNLHRSIIIIYSSLLFFPLLPSGSFFNSHGMIITWFSLSFVYSLNDV